jgi:hypothetical protein
MARPWRIEYGGALYHVFSRANNQQAIFVWERGDVRYIFTFEFSIIHIQKIDVINI